MNSEINTFDFFMEVKHVYDLYLKVGDVVVNDIDIANLECRGKALTNTLTMLVETGIICVNESEYKKSAVYSSYDEFCKDLNTRISITFNDELNEIFSVEKKYDENRRLFYFFKNSVPLKYMGLIMLLEDLGELDRIGDRDYIIDGSKASEIAFRDDFRKKISLEELNRRLIRQAEIGEEAELFALEYEKRKLIRNGIKRKPVRISEIDVSAGYDIISYTIDNNEPNKFIEVKSCDDSLSFFLSRNEIEVAKIKGNNYYLYLFERSKKEIVEIQNPYKVIFSTENEWIYEADTYKIHLNS